MRTGDEPAFPQAHDDSGSMGMSLRDYFAAKALVGWLSGPCQGDVLDEYADDNSAFAEHRAAVAKLAYEYADAMLAERAK
jgi:agmatine/peptidylarginine deiminase